MNLKTSSNQFSKQQLAKRLTEGTRSRQRRKSARTPNRRRLQQPCCCGKVAGQFMEGGKAAGRAVGQEAETGDDCAASAGGRGRRPWGWCVGLWLMRACKREGEGAQVEEGAAWELLWQGDACVARGAV